MAIMVRKKCGFTLIEVLIGTMLLLIATSGVLVSYIRCIEFVRLSRNTSLAVQAAQSLLETSRSMVVDTGPSSNPSDTSVVTAKLLDLADDAITYHADNGVYPTTCFQIYDSGYTPESCSSIFLEGYIFSYNTTAGGFNFAAQPLFCTEDYSKSFVVDETKNVTTSLCFNPTLSASSFFVSSLSGRSFVYFEELSPNFYEIQVSVCWEDPKTQRIYGEDRNLNGVLDIGEDANANGRIDSPVTIVSQAFVR